MFNGMSLKNKNILIGVLVFGLIIFEMSFLTNPDIIFTVNISIGFLVGFYICFGRDVLPGLFLSTISARFIGGILFNGFDVITSLPHTFVYLSFASLLTFGIAFALKVFNCSLPNTFRKAFKYVLIVGILSTVASVLPTIFHTITSDVDFFSELRLFVKPTTMGIGIFTTLIIFSSKYDTFVGMFKESALVYFSFLIIFNVITFFTFQSSIVNDNFNYIAPIMLVLFMIHAFIFNFRLLILSSISYIFYYSLLIHVYPQTDISTMVFSFNLLIVSILVVAIFSKVLIVKIQSHSKEVEETNEKLESMMKSTFDLFKIEEFIDKEQDAYVDTYLINVFNIVLQLFTKIDSGLCLKTDKNDVHFISSQGYEVTSLNTWNVKKDKINWDFDYPVHSQETNLLYKRIIDADYVLFEDTIPSIKESIHFGIPLGNNEFGGISIDIHEGSKEVFTDKDIENISHLQKMLISFYDKNQLSLRNANLKDDIVLSLIRTLELFDQYTGGHSEEVADLSKLIANEMGVPSTDVYNIYWAGIVHDIGKIGVDPAIINKKSRLTLEEYEEVKLHTLHGYSILNRSEDLKEIALLVRHHHEWWNGHGYPDKIKQNVIPFGSQILQVADSVSSMATKRSYSDIKTMNQIKEELILYSGTQFSPKVVEAMINLINNGHISNYYNSRRK
jgi:HD-GYP domain-containing protein (c-di-GMP phosphodiesterase class II)